VGGLLWSQKWRPAGPTGLVESNCCPFNIQARLRSPGPHARSMFPRLFDRKPHEPAELGHVRLASTLQTAVMRSGTWGRGNAEPSQFLSCAVALLFRDGSRFKRGSQLKL
jgi:hypothetical protein